MSNVEPAIVNSRNGLMTCKVLCSDCQRKRSKILAERNRAGRGVSGPRIALGSPITFRCFLGQLQKHFFECAIEGGLLPQGS